MFSHQPSILVYSPKDAENYANNIRNFGFISVKAAATEEELITHLPNAEVILGWRFPTRLLNQPISVNVRWFQSTGAGVDDLLADQSIPKNIAITRIVNQFGHYIAEYTFTYLLYLLKDVPRMRNAQKERRWDPFVSETLAGKRIGIAGLGSIGREIVRKARAFEMEVSGLSLSGSHSHLVDAHYSPDNWDQFVRNLDFLVLTLPLTKETHHIVNKEVLKNMKKEAALVNVGRGALINEQDLITVMESGHLKAAVLDVFEQEPLPANHPFYSLPNVYITSHLSGPSTVEGVTRFFVDNLRRYIHHQPLNGLVNRNLGY